MKISHRMFLAKSINFVSRHNDKDGSFVREGLGEIKHGNTPVPLIIENIVGDDRFFKVLPDSFLWRKYANVILERFIDSLDTFSLEDIILQKNIEEFLNLWFSTHIIPMPMKMLKLKLQELTDMDQEELERLEKADDLEYEEETEEIYFKFPNGVYDCTNGSSDSNYFFEEYYYDDDNDELNQNEDSLFWSAGHGSGNLRYENPLSLSNYDSELQRLARIIGRGGDKNKENNGRFMRASKSDISGITTGNNINMTIPSEIALLGSKETEDIFYDKFTKSKLQIFSSQSSITTKNDKNKGPIFIVLDTSGSMAGEPERMAKALSLGICEIAQRQKRPVCIVNYADSLSFFFLTDMERQKKLLLKFLGRSYGGGNNEDRMFRFLFEDLPKSPYFLKIKDRFSGADLLIVSDFKWMPIKEDVQSVIQKVRNEGMKFYALGIEYASHFEPMIQKLRDGQLETEVFDGYNFYTNCDYKFVYGNGYCKEIK